VRPQRGAGWADIYSPLEIGRRTEIPTGICQLLIDVVAHGVVLAHVVAAGDVNGAVLAGDDGQMPRDAAGVHQVRKQQGPGRSQVRVICVVGDGDRWGEIIRYV